MASAVASPVFLSPTTSTSSPGPKQGILLNGGRSPRHIHNGSLPLPASNNGRISAASSPGIRGASMTLPRTDSGSSTNSTTAAPGANSRASSIRKIRFAPLPIPRVQDEAELAQMDSPTAAGFEEDGVPVTPGSAASHNSAGSISALSGGILGLFNTGGEEANPDTASEAGAVSKARSRHWSKRLFKPLLKPTSSEKSGSISDDALWRPTSRDSVQSNTSNEGSPRARRMTFEGRTRHSSIGSAAGAPLARVSSANSSNPRRQRLLNGRVYGVNRAAFQNIKDTEPDFVEWGHGGAGSVNNRHGAGSSKYAGVQSGAKLSIGAIASPASSTAGGDEDDGTGMAWVRRRREQRERERREKEEKEQQQARQDTTTTTTTTTTSSLASDESEKDVLEMMPSPGTMGVTAGGTPSATPEEHHIVTAIQVPAPPHAHAHPHTHAQQQQQHHDALDKPAPPSEQSNKSSSESSDTDEEGETESDSEDDDEDDEDDEEENERRKTALGAGVEKISRHKEEQQ